MAAETESQIVVYHVALSTLEFRAIEDIHIIPLYMIGEYDRILRNK